MKFQYHRFFLLVLFSWVLGCCSCKKMIAIDPPRSELVTEEVFRDSSNAVASVLGVYIEMINVSTVLQYGNGGITVYTGLSGDELIPNQNYEPENEFYQNSIAKENGINGGLWTQAYKIIYNANACVEGLANSKTLSENLRTQLSAEARLARAFIYFNLVQLYENVPYITSIEFKPNSVAPVTNKSITIDSIKTELENIVTLLPDDIFQRPRIRPGKFAAMALLAQLYLYLHEWEKAEEMASLIIGSNIIELEDDLLLVFKAASKETIWCLPSMQPEFETAEAFQFVPGYPGYPPLYAMSSTFLEAFEPADRRKLYWLDSVYIDSYTYYYPYKYTLTYDGNSTSEEPYVIFRLAEQYLVRSEARVQQNKLDEARSDLNAVRARAGLITIEDGDQQTLLGQILQERRIELFCEWGHRWFDLKRTGTIDQVLNTKPGWQSTDALFPIPFNELLLNPFLTQNPGY